MTSNLTRVRIGPRRIGAVAGLVPAGFAILLFVILGGILNRGAVPWLAGIAVLSVAGGWLVGPLACDPSRSNVVPVVAYVLVGAFAYLFIGTIGSIWGGPPTAGFSDPTALAARLVGQLLYGLLYLPFWAGFIVPFAIVWILAAHAIRRRTGPAPVESASMAPAEAFILPQGIKPRRMVLFAAALIVAYGLFTAVLPLVIYNDPRPPWWFERPAALFVLFAIPAAIATFGALSNRRSLVIAAGAICLAQAYVAFSLVTIGFMIPAILLLVLGGGARFRGMARETRTTIVASVMVIALTVGAWMAFLGLTEEVCWSAARATDGSLVYQRLPVTGVMTIPPSQVAGGCDGGTLTDEGIGLGAIMASGAIGVAAASVLATRNRATDR
jgi:hypothetical protein